MADLSTLSSTHTSEHFTNQLPHEVEVIERVQESPTVFTLKLRFTDPQLQQAYSFSPGQFNMLYLYGVGEVAISIASDPNDKEFYAHTIRRVGRVTNALAKLEVGDRLGIRGPYGRGWPLAQARDKDLVLMTGGLGCAPVLSVINYALNRRNQYRRIIIMQGVKHSDDLIWQQQYKNWQQLAEVQVLIASSKPGPGWPYHNGRVTELIDEAEFDHHNCSVMMCGPEGMMIAAADELLKREVDIGDIYLSMERNMQCALGQCGHCQLSHHFVCKDGPVFNYAELVDLLQVARL